jgi:hypothetical protein
MTSHMYDPKQCDYASIDDNRVRNKEVLNLFNKRTEIDPRLQNYTSSLKCLKSQTGMYFRPESDPMMLESHLQNVKIKSEQITPRLEKCEEKPEEDLKDTSESIVTTPSSKHSAIINTVEKQNALEYGYSLDKRMARCTPIYTDLHKTCFSLSQVVLRHIKFSRGMLFLEDLAWFLKDGSKFSSTKNDIKNKIEFTPSQNGLKFSYCFNDNLKLDFSVAKPKYMGYGGETIESVRKELTFEGRNEEFLGQIPMQFSSDSEEENKPNDKLLRTFTFCNSEQKREKQNEVRSVIHEEREEFNDSRLVTGDNEWDSPIKRINFLNASHSSPSLISSSGPGLFRMNMLQCTEPNNAQSPVKNNIFNFKRAKASEKDDEESSSSSENESEKISSEVGNFVPCSPDQFLKKKRRMRTNQIANNPNMLINNSNCSGMTSSPGKSGNEWIQLNMCFNKSEESEYDVNKPYVKPNIEYEFSPFESVYKVKETEMKKHIEEEIGKFYEGKEREKV